MGKKWGSPKDEPLVYDFFLSFLLPIFFFPLKSLKTILPSSTIIFFSKHSRLEAGEVTDPVSQLPIPVCQN